MIQHHYNLVLASMSPRRKEILGWLGLPFMVRVSHVPEVSYSIDPIEIVQDIARLKGQHVFQEIGPKGPQHIPHPVVIAADTVVELQGEILGKPESRDHARQMLKKLSGQVHRVLTGVHLMMNSPTHNRPIQESFYCSTKVHFVEIPTLALENYLLTGDSLDKAGAYGVQGPAQAFISTLEGSYSNVVGFPLHLVAQHLQDFICAAHGVSAESVPWQDYFLPQILLA